MEKDYAPLTEKGKLLFEDEDGNARISITTRRMNWLGAPFILLACVFVLAIPMIGIGFSTIVGIWILAIVLLFSLPVIGWYMVQPRGPLKVHETGIFIDKIRWPFVPFERMTYITQKKDYPYLVIIRTEPGTEIRIRFDTDEWLETAYPFIREYFNRAHHFSSKGARNKRPPSTIR
jgi:hypothetical protein